MVLNKKQTFVFVIIAVSLFNSYSSLSFKDVVNYTPISRYNGYTSFTKTDRHWCEIKNMITNRWVRFRCSIKMNVDYSYFSLVIKSYKYARTFVGKRYQSNSYWYLNFPFSSLTSLNYSSSSSSIKNYIFYVKSVDSQFRITLHVNASRIDSSYVNYINKNRSNYINYLRQVKNKIISKVQDLKNTYASINNAKNDLQSEIRKANTEIANETNKITQTTNKRNSLQITNKNIKDSVAKLIADKLEKENLYNNCITDSTTISSKLETYKKYEENYSEEAEYNYLNKESQTFCNLNSSITTIARLLPQYSNLIYQLKKAVIKNYDVKGINKQLTSNKFYVYNEVN